MVNYIPLKKKYDISISNAKQEYLDNKDKIDEVYVNQLKTTWYNDVTSRNIYFILMFAVFCYTPVVYYILYLIYHDPKQKTSVDRFMDWMTLPITLALISAMSILMLTSWLIYTFGIMYLLYVLVPVIFLGGCLWSAVFYQHWVKPSTAVGIIALIGMITMLLMTAIAVGWSNILYMVFAAIIITFVAGAIVVQ
jgi:hypothetical protein